MILGMSLSTFTFVHVLISLIGIGTGMIVLLGLIGGKRLDGWTSIFLTSTVLTSATGFAFPFDQLLPSHKVGIISLFVLAVAIAARYAFQMTGVWRLSYVISATLALYFNVFVLVVQSFQKIPGLKQLAPTQSEPPFAIAQLAVLLSFIALGTMAAKKFREPAPMAMAAHGGR
jgi:hypothetical protein